MIVVHLSNKDDIITLAQHCSFLIHLYEGIDSSMTRDMPFAMSSLAYQLDINNDWRLNIELDTDNRYKCNISYRYHNPSYLSESEWHLVCDLKAFNYNVDYIKLSNST